VGQRDCPGLRWWFRRSTVRYATKRLS